MKTKKWLAVFAAEAVACLALALYPGAPTADLRQLTAPFALIGRGLRALSLLGGGWNVLAITLYAVLSLLPLLALALRRARRVMTAEDWLLALMSALLFAALYAAVNPSWPKSTIFAESGMSLLAFAFVFYTALVAWLLLRSLRAAQSADARGLRRLLRWTLLLLAAVFVYSAFAAAPSELVQSLQTLSAQNSATALTSAIPGASASPLFWTRAVFVLRTLVSMAADVLSVWVIFAALALLCARDAEDTALAEAAAEQTAKRSALALRLTLFMGLGIELLQLLLMRLLRSTSFTLTLPLGAMALCLGTLLLTRLVQENRRLRQDNDLFI